MHTQVRNRRRNCRMNQDKLLKRIVNRSIGAYNFTISSVKHQSYKKVNMDEFGTFTH